MYLQLGHSIDIFMSLLRIDMAAAGMMRMFVRIVMIMRVSRTFVDICVGIVVGMFTVFTTNMSSIDMFVCVVRVKMAALFTVHMAGVSVFVRRMVVKMTA